MQLKMIKKKLGKIRMRKVIQKYFEISLNFRIKIKVCRYFDVKIQKLIFEPLKRIENKTRKQART